jgi:hypothetical protein
MCTISIISNINYLLSGIFIIIFIKKSFLSNRIPILVFDNQMFELNRLTGYSLPSLKNYDHFKIGCSDRDVERDHIFNIDISLHSYFNVELNIA